MHKCLYMVCPSDYLDSIIDKKFKGPKYFFTSLANNVTLDEKVLKNITSIVKKKKIDQIMFVLSDDNHVILDALNSQKLVNHRGLKVSYDQLLNLKEKTSNTWELGTNYAMIVSYFLNDKIKQLKFGLAPLLPDFPEINGKLYLRASDSFRVIYPDMVCIDSFYLN